MTGNNGGPWGGGGGGGPGGSGSGGDNRGGGDRGGKRPGEGPQLPEIEELVKKGQEQLRVLMGGRGNRGPGGGGGPVGPIFTRRTVGFGAAVLVALWAYASFYTVQQDERSVELLFGSFSAIGEPGLNFAPWPVVRAEILPTTTERTENIGDVPGARANSGLMLTRDEAIVDIEFQVVYNISDPKNYLFNLADPQETVRAVAESAMRDIIARSELSPILNRDRASIASDLQASIQTTLDEYQSGIAVIRVNFARADPPGEVIDSFREVQAARQERDRLQRQADAYSNTVTAGARGQAAALQEQAEAYRAEVVNDAVGETSRFLAVYSEYVKAPDVTRKRMYLETMEGILGRVNKVLLDGVTAGAGGVLPYLPLDQLIRPRPQAGTAGAAAPAPAQTGGN